MIWSLQSPHLFPVHCWYVLLHCGLCGQDSLRAGSCSCVGKQSAFRHNSQAHCQPRRPRHCKCWVCVLLASAVGVCGCICALGCLFKKSRTLLWIPCLGVQNLTERGNIFTLPLLEASVAMEKYMPSDSKALGEFRSERCQYACDERLSSASIVCATGSKTLHFRSKTKFHKCTELKQK